MEEENKSVLFKAALCLAFLIGAASFLYACVHTGYVIGKTGFFLLACFSVLCTAGAAAADMSRTAFVRTGTKLSAFFFPFSINAGSLCVGVFLEREMAAAAVTAAAISAAAALFSAAVLVRRYLNDDF